MLAKTLERDHMNRKIISVSRKRQITIPLKFFKQLGLENEVECFLQDDALVIRPFRSEQDGFSVEILKELVDQGFSGKELIQQFEVKTKNIKTAIGKMTAEAERMVPAASFNDNFGENN